MEILQHVDQNVTETLIQFGLLRLPFCHNIKTKELNITCDRKSNHYSSMIICLVNGILLGIETYNQLFDEQGLTDRRCALPDFDDFYWEKVPTPILDAVENPLCLKNLSLKVS